MDNGQQSSPDSREPTLHDVLNDLGKVQSTLDEMHRFNRERFYQIDERFDRIERLVDDHEGRIRRLESGASTG